MLIAITECVSSKLCTIHNKLRCVEIMKVSFKECYAVCAWRSGMFTKTSYWVVRVHFLYKGDHCCGELWSYTLKHNLYLQHWSRTAQASPRIHEERRVTLLVPSNRLSPPCTDINSNPSRGTRFMDKIKGDGSEAAIINEVAWERRGVNILEACTWYD